MRKRHFHQIFRWLRQNPAGQGVIGGAKSEAEPMPAPR